MKTNVVKKLLAKKGPFYNPSLHCKLQIILHEYMFTSNLRSLILHLFLVFSLLDGPISLQLVLALYSIFRDKFFSHIPGTFYHL